MNCDDSLIAFVRMHTFKVRQDDVSVQRVSVLIPSVLNHRVDDSFLVVSGEVTSATRTRLLMQRRQLPIERRTRPVAGSRTGASEVVPKAPPATLTRGRLSSLPSRFAQCKPPREFSKPIVLTSARRCAALYNLLPVVTGI